MASGSRKKVAGQIDKLKKEIEANPRLESVFSICQDLGIDDPIHWMNNTSPRVIDWWIAYHAVKTERELKAYEGDKKSMEPNDAAEYLNNLTR
tara:strand:+ start:340 stop:618 length:279 start_codon:yes stop_codon:yes gene_type:complete